MLGSLSEMAAMSYRATEISIAFALLCMAGCNSPFDPRGPFRSEPVLYCILVGNQSVQYVRLDQTYDPPTLNPLDNTEDHPIVGAVVSILSNGRVIQFHDTTVSRDNPSRYSSEVHAYVCDSLLPIGHTLYAINVQAATFQEIHAEVVFPETSLVNVESITTFSYPLSPSSHDVLIHIKLSPEVYGYVLKIFLQYRVYAGGQWVLKESEVPFQIQHYDCVSFQPFYPVLKARDETADAEFTIYEKEAYKAIVQAIRAPFARDSLLFDSVVLRLTQVDRPLYAYYSTVNGFRDSTSTREDMPDYTNVKGGLGVFGCVTTQNVSFPIIDTLGYTPWPCFFR